MQEKFSHLPAADGGRLDARDVILAPRSIEGDEERDGYDLRARYANRAFLASEWVIHFQRDNERNRAPNRTTYLVASSKIFLISNCNLAGLRL